MDWDRAQSHRTSHQAPWTFVHPGNRLELDEIRTKGIHGKNGPTERIRPSVSFVWTTSSPENPVTGMYVLARMWGDSVAHIYAEHT